MKRKQVRFWSVLLVLTMLMGICMPASAAESTARFSDVPEGHWADGVIHQLRSLGLSEGVGDNAFGLGQTITRGEFLAFIVKVRCGADSVVLSGSGNGCPPRCDASGRNYSCRRAYYP